MFKHTVILICVAGTFSIADAILAGKVYEVKHRKLDDRVYYAVKNNSGSAIKCTSKYNYKNSILKREFKVPPYSSTIWKFKPKGTVVVCHKL